MGGFQSKLWPGPSLDAAAIAPALITAAPPSAAHHHHRHRPGRCSHLQATARGKQRARHAHHPRAGPAPGHADPTTTPSTPRRHTDTSRSCTILTSPSELMQPRLFGTRRQPPAPATHEEKKPWAAAQALPCIGPNQHAHRAPSHVAGIENAGEAQGAKPGGLATAHFVRPKLAYPPRYSARRSGGAQG